MKTEFFDKMDQVMSVYPTVYLLFCGLGWPRYNDFSKKYMGRVINTESSEATALDIAVGLAYEGKIPFVYTITPFLYRGFETIRTYINREKLHVGLVGAGRDKDYSIHDGYSHDAQDVGKILSTQENIWQYYPNTVDEMNEYIDLMVQVDGPKFISIPR